MDSLVLLTGVLCFVVGIFSGISGGGGGFVLMPYLLFLGLPPANALATLKFSSAGTSIGAITAFKGKGLIRKKLIVPFMAITLVCALIAAWFIPRIDSQVFEDVIGFVLIIMIPTLFLKKASLRPGDRSRPWVVAGFIAFTFFSFLQTMIGTGMGTMVVLVLMFLFGLNALEANATKRVSQSVQAVILVVLLGIQGLVVWPHAIAGLIGSSLGSHVGAHIAIKKGTGFVKIVLAVIMLVSGIVLIIW